jgi:hypothetical protein
MTHGLYKSSRNSWSDRPLCLRMSDSVPLASSACSGTTVLKTRSDARFSRETWLPLWRNSTKPARFSARSTRSPETLGSFGMSMRNFDGSPECFAFGCRAFGNAPSLQIKFDGFAKAGAGALDVFSLRSDVQLRATRNIPAIFPGNQRGESVGHKAMLADVHNASKVLEQSTFANYQLPLTRAHGRRDK